MSEDRNSGGTPRRRGDGVFSRRAVGLLCAVGLCCFAGAALVAIYADPQTEATSGANAYSTSAIGHKAWTGILEELDIPVVLSRNNSAAKAYESGGLLVFAQPDPSDDAVEILESFENTDVVLIVLPKWRGIPNFAKIQWLQYTDLLDSEAVEKILQAVDEEAAILRHEGDTDWRSVAWDILPQLSYPQLIKSDEISPIVYSDDGILLGEYQVWDTRIWILSDPDVINNSGIDEGDNAAFAVALVEELLPGGNAAVFDETTHGFGLSPSLWKALLSFPLNLAVLQALVAAAVLVWAAGGRFGAPLPPHPRLGAGKRILIDNTASLFQYAGKLTDILWRYREACLRDLGRQIHIPRELDRPSLLRWLDQVGAARGATRRYSDIDDEVTAAINGPASAIPGILRAALHLYRWKQEIIHGHRADPNGLRPNSGAGPQDRGRTRRRT